MEESIIEWAEIRGLLKPENAEKQALKFYEELGELCGGILKNKEDVIIDSIGDLYVVLVILRKQLDTEPKEINVRGLRSITMINEMANCVKVSIEFNDGYFIDVAISYLKEVSNHLGYNFDTCVERAYNEIKDRKGKLINGSFVKEDDL